MLQKINYNCFGQTKTSLNQKKLKKKDYYSKSNKVNNQFEILMFMILYSYWKCSMQSWNSSNWGVNKWKCVWIQ